MSDYNRGFEDGQVQLIQHIKDEMLLIANTSNQQNQPVDVLLLLRGLKPLTKDFTNEELDKIADLEQRGLIVWNDNIKAYTTPKMQAFINYLTTK